MNGNPFLPLLMRTRALHHYADWGFLLLRIVVGVIFIVHGYQKWGMFGAGPGASSPMTMVFQALAVIEPLFGIAILIGLFTQWAALVLALDMLAATYFKIMVFQSPFVGMKGTGWEFDALLFAANVLFFLHGAGALSVDGMKRG